MARQQNITTRPVREELPRLLDQRGISLRQLAAELEVPQSGLTRMLQGSRPINANRLRAVATYLDLPGDYFAEVREAAVIAAITSRPRLRDEIYYDRVKRRRN